MISEFLRRCYNKLRYITSRYEDVEYYHRHLAKYRDDIKQKDDLAYKYLKNLREAEMNWQVCQAVIEVLCQELVHVNEQSKPVSSSDLEYLARGWELWARREEARRFGGETNSTHPDGAYRKNYARTFMMEMTRMQIKQASQTRGVFDTNGKQIYQERP